ncbi:ribulose-phosphate 3-epimerase [Filimonas effusa]|uniref:Ribulose-phosphate 3-epimerase n=1 Tax=Filimonas effusa TaxID=2508721 RepID=A0A4Q1DBI1_9BACT|nr:ribulose-phosphate 3-epimerase [Filimonas effusa]RXK86670.1 ribulose-phosphate 3-epimerase [Filimonas effusa]
MAIIAPSLLAADFLRLWDECKMINESEAEWFHLDVMDGRFVPNISFGLPVIEHIRKTTKKECDVHLMIVEPEKYTTAFKEAGADRLTVHYEACTHLHRNVEMIRQLGMKAGVALNPHTPVLLLKEILPYIDQVCIMSVNPGFGGQQFIPTSLKKIAELKQMIRESGYPVLIQVDGGVSVNNAAALVNAGADVLVAGSNVFKAENPTAAIAQLKKAGSFSEV